jgi:VWFA-related protein
MKQKLFAVTCIAGLLAAQTPTQNPPAQQQGANDVIGSVTVRNVLVPVTVQDQSHNSVRGLTLYDFRLLDNGKQQKITQDMAEHPLSVVVLIQANIDVEQILTKIIRQSSAIESLVVGSDGEVAVMAFDTRIQTLTPFTSDEAQIDAAFKKLCVDPHARTCIPRTGSYTSRLNDATLEAITLLKSRPTSRRRVLLQIAANRDKGSGSKPREVLTEAELNNVVMYSMDVSQLVAALTSTPMPNRPDPRPPGSVFLGGGNIDTPTTQSQMNMGNWMPALKDIFDAAKGVFVNDPLDVYTRYTGGRQCGFKTDKALESCVAQIGDELHSQYLLSYSPNNENEGGFHQIVVNVLKPGLTVRTREGYWTAAKPE